MAVICLRRKTLKLTMLFAVATMVGASAFAQTTPQLIPLSEAAPSPNLYRAVVISRTVQAVNYAHRGEATKVDFAGTTLMPLADGWARVENKRGNLAITAEFGNLQRPSAIGGEYLTYVLWAISPEGRAGRILEKCWWATMTEQAAHHHRPAVVRADCDCGALLCSSSAQQRGRAREHRARRYPGNH